MPIDKIKGVGPKTALQFRQAGINNVFDLINFLPYRHEDYSNITTINNIQIGKATIRAHCEKISTRNVRRGLRITTASLADNSGKLKAVWFNQPYRETQLKSGDDFLFSGTFEFSYNTLQLTNPSVEAASDLSNTGLIMPIYRSIKGLKSTLVHRILAELKPLMSVLPDTLPASVVKNEKLLSKSEALLNIHFPKTISDIDSAKERLSFEELFQLSLASQLNRQENQKLSGWKIPFNQQLVKSFVKKLSFELTPSQRLAAWEIIKDLEKLNPMNRLLQGDVGSGKTVVAGLVACQVANYGFQTAIMVPTEVLANQHAETLTKLLRPFGISVGLLTGNVKGRARTELLKQIKAGSVQVIVGTHVLIQDAIVFHKLGFVVIDEQHRFGVDQRQKLLNKSQNMPHLLTMTATPIPRSLQLTIFGDLDISILSDMPSGRLPIISKIWSPNSRAQLYAQIDEQIAWGRQAYVICSLVEAGTEDEVKSVQVEYDKLRNSVFKHRRIAILHGKMKADEKKEIMLKFAAGQIDILVSTVVIEVGIDVPNATVIVIENADHFGLAQLHQLRGRVGRGEYQSYCYLINSSSAKPSERLRQVEKSNDGFYLAEVDLRLRGPGEVYGRAQHGALNLQIATFADTKMIARAQRQAKLFASSGENLIQYKQLESMVRYYQRLTTLN